MSAQELYDWVALQRNEAWGRADRASDDRRYFEGRTEALDAVMTQLECRGLVRIVGTS